MSNYLDQPVIQLHLVRDVKQWYEKVARLAAKSQVDRELATEVRLMMEECPPLFLTSNQRALLRSLCYRQKEEKINA